MSRPSMTAGAMILHADPVDPAGHCVRIVLAEKDVGEEVGVVRYDAAAEELAEISPYGTRPVLVERDLELYDARIIMEYLDERFPHPPLMPVDPVSRAVNRQLRYRISRDLYPLMHDMDGDNEIAAAAARKSLLDNLTAMAPAFSRLPYFMSEEYTLADCCLAPLLWRLDAYKLKLPSSGRSLLKYAERLFRRAAFQASLSEQERGMRKVSS